MARLALSLLGPVQLAVDGRPVKSFPYDKVTALLAYLVVERIRPQRREILAALLWPDHDPAAARHSLSQAIFSLRTLLADNTEPPLVSLTRHTVQLDLADEHWVDVVTFQALLDRRARHQHPAGQLCSQCAAELSQAVDLYRGDFLAQLSLPDALDFDEWLLPRRAAYRDQFLRAIDALIEFHERRSELREAAELARRQLALEPYREESQRHLMSVLARSGERNAALIHYERFRQLLRDDLGVEPDAATTGLFQRIRDSADGLPDAVGPGSRQRRHYRLPIALTPFVGRQSEGARLTGLLADAQVRLTTLVGPGGIGKTRLALHAAGATADIFADGACFVPLAGVLDGSRLAPAIADALSLQLRGVSSPREQLLQYLQDRELLLVLDNFEQLHDEAVFLTRLLERAPRLKLLVTSRERLHVQPESVVTVGGLDVPPDGETDNLESYGAVQLFIQTAQRLRSGFSPGSAELQAVAQVCRLVGGMPLAIELAATWVPVLSCAEIASEIRAGLDLLTSELQDLPERHQSIRRVFDYSWQMLTQFDQNVFKSLSVFHGGFRRDAAEHIVGRALPSLSILVSKSLLSRTSLGRYEMHELVRQYAEERLQRTPALAVDRRDRHAAYYLGMLAQRTEALQGGQQVDALAVLNAEIANLRAAWWWASNRGDISAVVAAAPGLLWFGELSGRYAETESAFADAIHRIGSMAAPTPDAERLRALTLARLVAFQGATSFRLGRLDAAISLVDRAIDHLRLLDSPRDLALALNWRALGASAQQDTIGEERYLRESINLHSQAGDQWGLAYSLNDLGLVLHRRGEADEARRLCRRGLELAASQGDKRGMAFALRNLGVIEFGRHDFAAARRYLSECLETWRSIGFHWGVADALCQLGVTSRSEGDCDQACHELEEALMTAADVNSMSLVLEILVELAELRARVGRLAEAKALLGAIARHPASEPQVRDRATALLSAWSDHSLFKPTAADADQIVRRSIRAARQESRHA